MVSGGAATQRPWCCASAAETQGNDHGVVCRRRSYSACWRAVWNARRAATRVSPPVELHSNTHGAASLRHRFVIGFRWWHRGPLHRNSGGVEDRCIAASTVAALQLRRRRGTLHRSSGGGGGCCIVAPAASQLRRRRVRCVAAPAAAAAASQLRRPCCIAAPAALLYRSSGGDVHLQRSSDELVVPQLEWRRGRCMATAASMLMGVLGASLLGAAWRDKMNGYYMHNRTVIKAAYIWVLSAGLRLASAHILSLGYETVTLGKASYFCPW